MFTLRAYQEECVTALFDYFDSHPTGNPLIALPPGAGKSLVIAEFCRRALTWYPTTRILNIVHVKELIAQTHKKIVDLWPTAPAGIYSAGLNRRDVGFPITFAGIASIAPRIADFGHIDLVIIDEADMVSHKEETQYRRALEALRSVNPAVRVIGLTATPFRLGLGLITDGGVFTDIVVDYCTFDKFNGLVDDGFLCPLIPRRTDTELSVEGVHIQGDEFVQSELQDACNKDAVTRAALMEAAQLAHDRQHWLVFTTGVKHATSVRDGLLALGISAVCVHTDLKPEEGTRDGNIAKFRAGQVRAMVGVGIFGVGFDAPEVDCILMLRPTMSSRIWVQYLGRGLRPHPAKRNTLVLDFARNTVRLGPVNDPVLPRKPGQKRKGMVPFKLCDKCSAYNHTRSVFCIDCGYEFPVVFKGTKHASDADLIRRDDTPPPPPKPKKERPPPPAAQVEEYRVTRVEFAKHRPRDPEKAESLKVSYVCGLRIIDEFLCFGHPKGFPKHKAHQAWRQMTDTEPPDTVDEALERTGELNLPSGIRVLQGKYSEVVGYEFNSYKPEREGYATAEDDDIPF